MWHTICTNNANLDSHCHSVIKGNELICNTHAYTYFQTSPSLQYKLSLLNIPYSPNRCHVERITHFSWMNQAKNIFTLKLLLWRMEIGSKLIIEKLFNSIIDLQVEVISFQKRDTLLNHRKISLTAVTRMVGITHPGLNRTCENSAINMKIDVSNL